MVSHKKFLSVLIVIILLAVALGGCGGGAAQPAQEEPAKEEPAAEAPAATEEPAAEAPAATEEPAAEAPAAEAGDDGTIKIGLTMLFDDLWLTTLRDAMTAYAESQPGVELIAVDSKEDVAVQLGQVENFVAQGVDAIIVIPANTDAVEPMTKAAQDAGIPLVYVNRKPADLPEGVAYVGSDSIDAGIFQAEWLAEKLGGKGNVVIMQGNLAQEAAQQRTAGVKQVFEKYPDIKIIKEDTGNWSRDQGLALMENWLSTGDQIDAVASNNDEMAIGALSAIEAAGKLGQILVAGVDASPDALAEMDKGRLNMTVFQNAAGQGEGGIKAAIALAKGEKIDQITWIPYEPVTPENYKDYMK
ncbi:MAG: sugar ABC transporter substrate-binding protein [Anaerolineae bacterium]|nr:sugar ABC transporter substrate-binding protein [Anaerolineae bacterium]